MDSDTSGLPINSVIETEAEQFFAVNHETLQAINHARDHRTSFATSWRLMLLISKREQAEIT